MRVLVLFYFIFFYLSWCVCVCVSLGPLIFDDWWGLFMALQRNVVYTVPRWMDEWKAPMDGCMDVPVKIQKPRSRSWTLVWSLLSFVVFFHHRCIENKNTHVCVLNQLYWRTGGGWTLVRPEDSPVLFCPIVLCCFVKNFTSLLLSSVTTTWSHVFSRRYDSTSHCWFSLGNLRRRRKRLTPHALTTLQ